MCKARYVYLKVALALFLLAAILLVSSGVGALDSEKRFIAGLQNSLYHLDLAKHQWAEERRKSELDTPTLPDLAPYLGDWKGAIEKFTASGISYRITSMSEPQSDVATLTRNLRFQRGICRFYPAGTSYCLHTGWYFPRSSTTSSFLAIYFHYYLLFAAALFLLALGSLLVFAIKHTRSSKQASDHQVST